MFYFAISYIKFLLRSKNQHGVHSPFVYDLLTKCIYKKQLFSAFKLLKKYREALLTDTSVIEVTDFGQGSRIFKSNTRSIQDIAKHAGLTLKKQKLLFKITTYFQPKNSLELGTSLGLATMTLALASKKKMVTTIEGCSETSAKAGTYFKEFGASNIQLINTKFSAFFTSEVFKTTSFDLVYIDGNHNKENTLKYFETLLPKANNDSIFIFDDIYWSKEMTQAWEIIAADTLVTVSIDCFYWGIVFFRKEQEKQHFILRM
ncbi:O-methyltransferase [Patiriisocius sp. Uisw_017]|jgi:predicted O-methyltransferase YrrM|uniref:O-methyltransferase n=1 Tax=Patiriisocius sp. Uisw_017 TaxID=3230968 RepID=UPI0039ECE107